MKKFIEKAVKKIEILDKEDIKRIFAQQLEELEMRDVLLDSYNAGFFLINEKMKVLYCNKTVKNLVPVSNCKDFKNNDIFSVIKDKEIKDFLKHVFNEKIDKEESEEFSFQIGSDIKIIRTTVFPKFTEFQEQICCLIRFNDVTVERVQATKLRRSENLASMTTMAAGVAHEIKNPLASISIYLQLLNKKFEKLGCLDKEKADKYLSVIGEEIERLNSIVVDFLFAVKPLNINLRFEDINKLIKDLVDFVKPELNEKNIKTTLDLSKFLPKLEIDSALFRQATLNLINNSIYAIEQKKGPKFEGEISISTQQVGDNVQTVFPDNGCGMSNEQMSKIFEPYFTTKDTGTGLGLTVFYKIVKEHKGEFSVQSELNKGTSFLISFPVPSSERKKIESGIDLDEYEEEK